VLQPDDAAVNLALAHALQANGKLGDAVVRYRHVLELNPNQVEAHHNLGTALAALGELDAAVWQFRQALLIDPDNPLTQLNLGRALLDQGNAAEAAQHYKHALALEPHSATAHCNLGVALQTQGRLVESATHFERAIALAPDFAVAHNNLGLVLRLQGRMQEARAHHDRALKIEPDNLQAKFGRCMAELPLIYANAADIADRRRAYEDRLDELCRVETGASARELAAAVGSSQPFFLAYQGHNDRDLQRRYGALICRVMGERYPPAPLAPPPAADEPVRIGVVSGFFCAHSNWKVPIKGWLSQLDRRRFKIFGYYPDVKRDAATQQAAQLCARFVAGRFSIDWWRATILSDAPHVLIYPEIGMNDLAVQLAAQRLAPIQCNSWGHPDTSGFPTLDYFLSSDLMEPTNGDDHYTEQLVRLPNLSIYYEPVVAPAGRFNRPDLGLRPSATVYWCGQSLFKYLPQYDQVFPRIAEEVGDCQFAFLDLAPSPHATRAFRKRLEEAFAARGLSAPHHCIFLPPLDQQQFIDAVGQCDVVLDSIGWSGCNSTLEGLVHDLPIVTMTGTLMRARHTTAILKMIGVYETITETLEGYIATAVLLARDLSMRSAIKERMATRKHRAYRDRSCITALEDFLDRVARPQGPERLSS
jgi:protein O-GlcNAc transferase